VIRRGALAVLCATALGACAAPSSFEGLSGGSKVDESLAAPRPLSPMSVTMVSTSRPRLRWEIQGDGVTGAVVEMSRTRAFEAGSVKEFSGRGRELVVPEDLEPGIWFWRLRGLGDAKTGTATSPIWEVLVRGPAKHGASDAPTGSLLDVDGDGEADLAVGSEEQVDSGDDRPWILLQSYVFRGLRGTIQQDNPGVAIGVEATLTTSSRITLSGGIDVDGDGYADLAQAAGDERFNGTAVMMGGPKGLEEGHFKDLLLPFNPFVMDVQAAGDMNGDGYGDILVGQVDIAFAALGGASGPASFMPIPTPIYGMPALQARPILGGFDADGDGLADVAISPPVYAQGKLPVRTGPVHGDALGAQVTASVEDEGTAPPGLDFVGKAAVVTRGARDLGAIKPRTLSVPSSSQAAKVEARAFASGDFDGDGRSDIAATMITPAGARLCIWLGDAQNLFGEGACTAGNAGDTAFGESLTAADLDGDGQDELLATARLASGASGVRAVTFTEAGLTVTPIAQLGFGGHLTTIWPGRPGKARWAAVDSGGRRVGTFVGTDLDHTIERPTSLGSSAGFGLALR